MEAEKKDIVRKHDGFTNSTGSYDRKTIEATEAFKAWKADVNADYARRINDLKEQLEDLYQTEKQKELTDYPIFMAIADKIGYDATGKEITENELTVIGQELKRFISHIEKTEAI